MEPSKVPLLKAMTKSSRDLESSMSPDCPVNQPISMLWNIDYKGIWISFDMIQIFEVPASVKEARSENLKIEIFNLKFKLPPQPTGRCVEVYTSIEVQVTTL